MPMHKRVASVVMLAAYVGAGIAGFSARTVAQDQPNPADATPAPFNPQMSALMHMLIQPRHARLGLAGKAENWPLAAYALKELRQGFAVVAKAVPRWQGRAVPELVEAAVDHPITLIDYAIKLRYAAQANAAYVRLTEGCN